MQIRPPGPWPAAPQRLFGRQVTATPWQVGCGKCSGLQSAVLVQLSGAEPAGQLSPWLYAQPLLIHSPPAAQRAFFGA